MFEGLKKKYAHFYIKHNYLHKNVKALNYNRILSDSLNFLIIMPREDSDFFHSLNILKYFLIHKKIVTLFLPEYKYNLIPEKERYHFFSYLPEHVNRFYLPDKTLVNRLKAKEFDIVIDLNRNSDIFFSAIANVVKSKLRVSFTRDLHEKYYNLLISGMSSEPEVAYRTFLNYLQMF